MITVETNYGSFILELDFENTPKTAENFLNYAKSGFYDGTIFHRVIDGFMVQGGGFEIGMNEKATQAPIENEADKGGKNELGTIAMARTTDPHSASSQFFINVSDNQFLNFSDKTSNGWGYCVFGRVMNGMEIINKIKSLKTTSRAGHQDVPIDDVVIEKVTVTTVTEDVASE